MNCLGSSCSESEGQHQERREHLSGAHRRLQKMERGHDGLAGLKRLSAELLDSGHGRRLGEDLRCGLILLSGLGSASLLQQLSLKSERIRRRVRVGVGGLPEVELGGGGLLSGLLLLLLLVGLSGGLLGGGLLLQLGLQLQLSLLLLGLGLSLSLVWRLTLPLPLRLIRLTLRTLRLFEDEGQRGG